MAQEANFLQGLNMILSQQQERERFRVQQALAMMQFAQQKKIASIAIAEKSLTMADKQNKQLSIDVAQGFLDTSGLSGMYVSAEMIEGESETPISKMVSNLTSYEGGKFSKCDAQAIARAMHSFYVSKDPSSVVNLAKKYGDIEAARIDTMEIDGKSYGYGTEKERKLYRSINKLSGEADLLGISEAARESLQIKENIKEETTEFIGGKEDAYTFERALGETDDLMVSLDYLREETGDLTAKVQAADQTLETMQSDYEELNSNVARTDEESERYYRLPEVIQEQEKKVTKMQNEINRRLQIIADKRKKEGEEQSPSSGVGYYGRGSGGQGGRAY